MEEEKLVKIRELVEADRNWVKQLAKDDKLGIYAVRGTFERGKHALANLLLRISLTPAHLGCYERNIIALELINRTVGYRTAYLDVRDHLPIAVHGLPTTEWVYEDLVKMKKYAGAGTVWFGWWPIMHELVLRHGIVLDAPALSDNGDEAGNNQGGRVEANNNVDADSASDGGSGNESDPSDGHEMAGASTGRNRHNMRTGTGTGIVAGIVAQRVALFESGANRVPARAKRARNDGEEAHDAPAAKRYAANFNINEEREDRAKLLSWPARLLSKLGWAANEHVTPLALVRQSHAAKRKQAMALRQTRQRQLNEAQAKLRQSYFKRHSAVLASLETLEEIQQEHARYTSFAQQQEHRQDQQLVRLREQESNYEEMLIRHHIDEIQNLPSVSKALQRR